MRKGVHLGLAFKGLPLIDALPSTATQWCIHHFLIKHPSHDMKNDQKNSIAII